MRYLTIILVSTIVLFSCSENKKTPKKDECNNRFEFISCNDSIPSFVLDISKDYSVIRNELNDLYPNDLCEECSWISFKIPFLIEGKEGFLKILVDYDYPICEDCPIPIRLRQYFYIISYSENSIYANGEFIEIDSLELKIFNYLEQVEKEDLLPESYDQVTYRILWSDKSKTENINSILTVLYQSHLNFVEQKLLQEDIDICSLNEKAIEQLKQKYPLRIELDLGKFEK